MRKNEVERYAELLYLPHHTSLRHPPMPRENRAAQFAPFAALTGHVDAVAETARLTQPRAALDEGVIAELDARIGQLRAQIGTQPAAEITYFVPDHKKEGGAYVTVRGRVCKIRDFEKQIVLEDGTIVPVEQVMDLHLL
ncbi:hypothetical protein ACTQ34_05915 [Agathobaculum sp. LCP25S3_E8]|uniref:hypothetical protein n=1 Tax=Agathobaculum sp. LCP25S3_E8 TaxID=3438735 RepID=UPI003F93EDB9